MMLRSGRLSLSASLLVLASIFCPYLTLAQTVQPGIFINAGGNNYTDNDGNQWVADDHYAYHDGIGHVYTTQTGIADTDKSVIYQSERWDSFDDPPLVYTIPMENGDYHLKLHFAEIYATAAGSRIFSVSVGGTMVIENLDIYEEVGGNTALVKDVWATVTNGELKIEFHHNTNNPKINAFEIHPVVSIPVLSAPGAGKDDQVGHFKPIYINAGGDNYVDSEGNVWVSDDGAYESGYTHTTQTTVAGTTKTYIYQSERWGTSLIYRFEIPNAEYNVKLHFAEIYFTAPGSRIFSVSVGGTMVIENLDITSEVGSNKALVKEVSTTVTDGVLIIMFHPVADNTKINAIEIHQVVPFTPIYINAGGDSYTDSDGHVWVSDSEYGGFKSGLVHSVPDNIRGTDKTHIYQSERYCSPGDPAMEYSFKVPNGDYKVKLHFAEIYFSSPGSRIFSVFIFGTVIENLDIIREVGSNVALVKEVSTTVTEGELTIKFHSVKDNAKISAIEIQEMDSQSQDFVPIRINAGGEAFVDPAGNEWSKDNYFNIRDDEQESISVDSPITNTENPELYRTLRVDHTNKPDLVYAIPITNNGEYTVVLHFAEIFFWYQYRGARVFDVVIQDQVTFEALDVFKAAGGGYSALIKTATVLVENNLLTIDFVRRERSPIVSGIEVLQASAVSQTLPTPGPTTEPTEIPTVRPTPQPTFTSIDINEAFTPIYINAGGSNYTDNEGNVWIADDEYGGDTAGSAYLVTDDITGTSKTSIYQSERWDASLAYTFKVPNGDYNLKLHFAEVYFTAPGSRIFSVSVGLKLVIENLDIIEEAGGPRAALVKEVSATVSDGELKIKFYPVVDNPKLNAIEIHPSVLNSLSESGTLPPTDPLFSSPLFPTYVPTVAPTQKPQELPPPIRINAGGGAFTDTAGKLWSADMYYSNPSGEVASVQHGISNADDPRLYQTERWDDTHSPKLVYSIPISRSGDYEVTLHFSDNYEDTHSVGARKFDVFIQGQLFIDDLDIYDEVGAFTALVKATTVFVEGAFLYIELVHVTQNPTISGIEVVPVTVQASPPLPELDDYASSVPSSAPSIDIPFSPYHINVGGDSFIDKAGNTWDADLYVTGGTIGVTDKHIDGTDDPQIYQTERWGSDMLYEIPVPNGDYEITLHFAEIYWLIKSSGERVFNVLIEGKVEFSNIDIFDEVGSYHPMKKVVSVRVIDEFITIEFRSVKENPKLSAIEVTLIGHYAHAVPGGPYLATDIHDAGTVTVTMDGSFSHTHGPGARLFYFKYFLNGTEIGGGNFGSGTVPDYDLEFPVGVHTVWMEVGDTDGSVHRDFTTVTVRPFGFPDVESLSPDDGDIQGGEAVTIVGYGFNYNEADTIVHFGQFDLTGPGQIRIANDSAIEILSVPPNAAGEVSVSVETPLGSTNVLAYRYINFSLPPVKFHPVKAVVPFIYGPSSLTFGPDGKLYVSTLAGTLYKLTLDENHNVIDTVFSDKLALTYNVTRTVLGIAFDPMDTSENPAVYVTHSYLFHGELISNNAKVSRVSGASLDIIEDVITGLPVSDHDHALNGIEFGDHGELYIQSGGNTNAGVPGEISQSGEQEDGFMSSATLVAYLSRENFDGKITYDEKGNQVTGLDVEVFASGLRNSYDIVLHSNGNLYAADNGANNGYGAKSVTCREAGEDPHEADKLIKVVQGAYYGHPNRKRGKTDPRQCTWWSMYEKSNEHYTAPMAELVASSNGIIEFQSNHFGGQLRGHLIIGRYQGALYDVTLSEDGTETINNPATLVDEGGLDVTQGPDGSLFVAQNFWNKILVHKPNEIEWTATQVKSVSPRRGPVAGGSLLSIYGENLEGSVLASVGGVHCPLVGAVTSKKIQCQLPRGSEGWADVIVRGKRGSSVYPKAYKYITGKEA